MAHKLGKIGFTCGSFDLLHAGHVEMLKEAKDQCDFLIVGLQSDPTLDRKEKNKPIQSVRDREIVLRSIKYVDMVLHYDTEAELLMILRGLEPDVRILGADWKGKKFTGWDLPIDNYFNSRNHTRSTSELRQRIYDAEREKRTTH